MSKHRFVGFGFGPIQSGLFVDEAFKSGNFDRIVIAEIDEALVKALRENNGSYYVNVACDDCIVSHKIDNIEIFNPLIQSDREAIIEAISQADEIATSLPSVDFYDKPNGVAQTIAEGLKKSKNKSTIIYTAENNNHAADILSKAVSQHFEPDPCRVQFLDTVIGKMSQVAADPRLIAEKNLKTITPGLEKAFLVEQFNRILVTRTKLDNFKPGIEVFVQKEDLIPFEEAKLYGHNAIHALLAYLGLEKGCKTIDMLAEHKQIMDIARAAFIDESGAALVKKYAHLNDELFTTEGYKNYALNLLSRMTNPHLCDSVQRAARDPKRKLGYNDRFFGTMRLCLQQNIQPCNIAKGAAAAIRMIPQSRTETPAKILENIWGGLPDDCAKRIIEIIESLWIK